jgi:hypothetical protein
MGLGGEGGGNPQVNLYRVFLNVETQRRNIEENPALTRVRGVFGYEFRHVHETTSNVIYIYNNISTAGDKNSVATTRSYLFD